jgi:hypothetical protein
MIFSTLSLVVLAAACAWAAEPLAARKCLVAVLVVVLMAGAPARDICAAAALVVGAGCLVRAAGNDGWYGFCGGVAGAGAVLLAPSASVAVAAGFLALFAGWRRAPLGQTITWFAAGWFDVLGFVWAVEKLRGPRGHVFDVQPGTFSLLQIGIAFAFLAAGAALWRLDSRKTPVRWRFAGGVAAVLVAVLVGLLLAEKSFGAVTLALRPTAVTAAGAAAAAFAVWRAVQGRGRWVWVLAAAGLLAGQVFWPVGEIAATAFLAPVAASDFLWWRVRGRT